MPNIGIKIDVDRTQVVAARAEIAALARDKKKYGLDISTPTSLADSVNRVRGGGADTSTANAARSAGVFRKEMEGARKAVAEAAKDFERLIKITSSARKDTFGPTTNPTSHAESDRMRREALRAAGEYWKTVEQKNTRKTAAQQYFEQHGNYGRTVTSGGGNDTPGGTSGGGMAFNPHWGRRALGWGLAAAGGFSVLGFIGSSRSAYRSAIDEESPLFARGIRGSRQRAGVAAGIGVDPAEWYGLENSLSRTTGLNERTGLARSAMLTATFAKAHGLDPAEAAGLRGSIYNATGSNSRIPDGVLLSMSEATKKGLDKSRLPELLTMINRGTQSTVKAMHGAGVSGSQISAITALSTAAMMLKEGTSYKQLAKSGEFGNLMLNGMQDAGSPAGNIMLFKALGGYDGAMSWDKVHEMNLMKQGGFLKRPDILQNLIGGMSGSAGARAGQLETFFKSWGIDGAASDSLIQMHDSGFLKRLSSSKGKSIEKMAAGGDAEAKRWLAEIAKNPALGRQATEATKDLVKIELGERFSKLFEPLEMSAAKLTGALADGDWKKSFSILGKAAGEMGPVSKTLLAAGGLFMAGGVTGLAGKAGGGALLGSLMGPGGLLALAGLGGTAAYGTFKDGGNFQPQDRLTAITGKGPSAKYSDKWIPFKAEFDEAAKKYGLDPALLYSVGRAESGYNPNAISGKGAGGVMQLMPDTAAELGVKNNFDPKQNIDGGAKYLSWLLKKYDGDTDKALAAYNWGPARVDKHGVGNLPTETEAYIRKVKTGQQGYFDSSQAAAAGGTDTTMLQIAEALKLIATYSERTATNTGRPLTTQPLSVGTN